MALRASNNPITHDMNSRQNDPRGYPQCTYHKPEPTNMFRVNPLVFSSLKNVDVENLHDRLGQVLQDQYHQEESRQLKRQKICDESHEIKSLKARIQSAHVNQARAQQINENQARKVKEVIKDSELDEVVLSNLESEKQKEKENQTKKRQERFQAKYVQQEQMKDREKQRAEAMAEYMRDKELVNDAVNQIKEEDIAEYEEDRRKKAITKMHMENAYAEKAERKRTEKENEEMRKEAEKKYLEDVANREREFLKKKSDVQGEKDKRFEQLFRENARKQAEKDYWENMRNDLHIAEDIRKTKLLELEEKAKKQRQKEDMLQWAIEQMKQKELKKKEEEKMESEFKRILLEKYAEEERLDQYNAIKRKQRQMDLRNEIERQWKLKLELYQKQKEYEIAELEKAKNIEREKRIIIEEEKARLIKENEEVFRNFYAKAYYESLNGMVNNTNTDQQKPNY